MSGRLENKHRDKFSFCAFFLLSLGWGVTKSLPTAGADGSFVSARGDEWKRVEHWGCDSWQGNSKLPDRSLSQCHCVHNKFHMIWPGNEGGLYGEPWHGSSRALVLLLYFILFYFIFTLFLWTTYYLGQPILYTLNFFNTIAGFHAFPVLVMKLLSVHFSPLPPI
jgi:hypothetical protein